MKKYFRYISIILGVLFLLLIIANFGFNYWLKNNLDDFIKKNSDYNVSYKNIDVDLGTGNILATGITINNKNPQNLEILGFQGTVDTLSIARLGIIDAVFNKKINTSDLVLKNPNLNITLPLKKNNAKDKKQNDIALENIKITNGNIQIFRATKQKFLSVKDFNLTLKNLQLSEETIEGKLPFVFDEYSISGKNFFFRPDNVYAFTAKNISTENGQMNLKDFTMNPLLSHENFIKFYPKKRNLFEVKTSEMEFKDFILKDDKITLTKVRFENPEIKMFTTNVKPSEKKKNFTYDVQLEDVFFNNAKINIINPNGSPKFSAGNLNIKINKFLMNEETAKSKFPFQYNDFSIKGEKINFVSNTQNINLETLNFNPKNADIQNISVKPTISKSDKPLMNIDAKQVNIKINELAFVENKLKLNIGNVLVDQLNGTITGSKPTKTKEKRNFNGIAFPLIVKNFNLKNSNLILDKDTKHRIFNDLNLNIQNFEMNENTVKNTVPFKLGFYSLTTRNFSHKTDFYTFSSSLLKVSKNNIQISNFAMKPQFSRSQFIKMIPAEKDLYDLKINQISMNGSWDFGSTNRFLNASQVTLDGVNATIFRSKIPKDDLTEKPLYSKLLRNIKFPMYIQNLDIKNSFLQYEEDTKQSEGPGKLTFNNFNLNAKNLNSAKMKGKPTQVPISINCLFMNTSPMNLKWNFDTANANDAFSISGNIADLPASGINAFIEPYLKIRAIGVISNLIFNFKGNTAGLNGSLKMKHQNLKVFILKPTGEINKILSSVANVFIRTNSGKYPESVLVDDVQKNKTKSFFNLFWKGIEEGLKKTLIGKNVEKTEKSVKNTVQNTKSAIKENKKNLEETKKEVKEKAENVKEKVRETKEKIKKKEGLRNLFKKKQQK